MLGDISGLDKIYIVCDHTDMRKSIDGLCAIVEDQLKMIRRPVCSIPFLWEKTGQDHRPDFPAANHSPHCIRG